MSFGEYIKQLRESRELTQSEAAKAIGISPQKLWDAENGIRYTTKAPRKVLEGMARVYRVPIGVIEASTKIRVITEQTRTEQLAEFRADLSKMLLEATKLCNEARTYTPELEAYALSLFKQISTLKSKVENAYGLHYSNTQNRSPNVETVEKRNNGSNGNSGT